MSGFGNDFATEALEGALPVGMNSPQRPAYGLYGEQLSGTAFTAPGHANQRTWCYRIRPSVAHQGRFARVELPYWRSAPDAGPDAAPHAAPDGDGRAGDRMGDGAGAGGGAEHGAGMPDLGQYRWDPVPHAGAPLTFPEGMRTMTVAGDLGAQSGMAAHVYLATASMEDEYLACADGELLVIPQEGRLRFLTELGVIDLAPRELAILPRGLVYRVEVLDGPARGFACENYGAPFALPERGPIGANCMANRRDFLTPVAAFEDREAPSSLTLKWGGRFHRAAIGQSPLDVVAWHGNYAPAKYDLEAYCPVGAVLFDHPDPSIFTVLTAPSARPGTAEIDLVLFRDRWNVAEGTFRPPWYHRNVMSELMGNIHGQYDAKPTGFAPGGISLHNTMLPHGPDRQAHEAATAAELEPARLTGMSFMLETRLPQRLTRYAAREAPLQNDYQTCWANMPKRYNGTKEGR